MKKLTMKLKKLTWTDWFYIIGFGVMYLILYIAVRSVI